VIYPSLFTIIIDSLCQPFGLILSFGFSVCILSNLIFPWLNQLCDLGKIYKINTKSIKKDTTRCNHISNVIILLFHYSKELLYYRWHVHMTCTHVATYCVVIQTQRTQISGRNNNGTKHSGGPPEDGREKRPKHVGVLYLQTRF
jgi:hypothetical protein